MHDAGLVAADMLDEIVASVFPGQTTGKIDALIEQMIKDKGVESATVGYRGYQHASCISVNHVVCHGIPSDKILKEGDISLALTGTAVGVISLSGYTPDIFAGPLMGYFLDKFSVVEGHQYVYACIGLFSIIGLIASSRFARITKKIK